MFGVGHRLGGEVELDWMSLGGEAGGLAYHPAVDLRDEPELLGCRQEAIGQHDVAVGAHHPDE